MFDTGTTAFMIMSCGFVLLMSPALALFYGGLSRKKNVVNTMLMCILAMCVVGCTWALIGDSIAYGNGADAFSEDGVLQNPATLFIGGLERLGSSWALPEIVSANGAVTDDATLSSASYGTYPSIMSVAFQATFAMVTTAIVTGSLAGRAKFGAVALIVVVWPLIVYAPMAHMVWGGGIIGNENAIGAIDFAGGTAVHICSGLAGLIFALILGKRHGFDTVVNRPHNVPFVMLGGGMLFMGWFGFNGGSALVADGNAGLAVANTLFAGCAAGISWILIERITTGAPTLVGAMSGIVAGLVVITPACGFVEPWAAMVLGLIVSPICYVFIARLKRRLGWDDALDAFGLHGVGGIVGAVLTGVFATPELSWSEHAGLLYTGDPTLLISQIIAVLFTIVFVGVITAAIGFAVKLLFGGTLRVDKHVENTGLDATLHGESAYPAFSGLD